MIKRIEHLGKFIDDSTIAGERRADGVAPAHGNGIQLSRDRFLVLNSTLRFRGTDDNHSGLWELRKDAWDGPVIREGCFVKSIDDWYPLGPQYRCVKQFGHPTAFGVPKGALLDGRPVPHANVFAVKVRIVARVFVPEGGHILWKTQPPEVRARTQDVLWLQFRLNDAEDDLEILQPLQPLRQVGYEAGDEMCCHGNRPMNASFVPAVPFNAACDEWVDMNHFGLHREVTPSPGATPQSQDDPQIHIAALRYRFNPARGLYEWVQTGPLIGPGLFEASISPHRGDWVIAARRQTRDPGIAWARVHDPFTETPDIVVPTDVRAFSTPLTHYKCPDGITRLCCGDSSVSPHGSNRDPIFIWDIDPDDGFRARDRHTIYSPRSDGNPIPHDHDPLADMIKLLPHVGGSTQTLIHRVRTCAVTVKEWDHVYAPRPMTAGDFQGTAMYYAAVHYDQDYPPMWCFA